MFAIAELEISLSSHVLSEIQNCKQYNRILLVFCMVLKPGFLLRERK
jgi:hypothetical protein